jgi:AcrR family transcriptional regulator
MPILLLMVGQPNRDRKAERREATRREILAAAWAVAETNGVAGLSLREVALRVGMRPPSLYSHFDSKNAIYDAMFEQAWREYIEVIDEAFVRLPTEPRAALLCLAQTYFDFATANLPRHLLMSQRVVPGFEPSPKAYQPAVEVLERFERVLRSLGVHDPAALDLATALIAGLVSQQLANEPGGSRWRDLLPRVMNMYADEVRLAPRET